MSDSSTENAAFNLARKLVALRGQDKVTIETASNSITVKPVGGGASSKIDIAPGTTTRSSVRGLS